MRREVALAVAGAVVLVVLVALLSFVENVDASLRRVETSLADSVTHAQELSTTIRRTAAAVEPLTSELATVNRNLAAAVGSTGSIADNVQRTGANVRRAEAALDVDLPTRRR